MRMRWSLLTLTGVLWASLASGQALRNQATNAEGGAGVTITCTVAVSSGDLLTVIVRDRDGSTVSSVSDTVNGSWTLAGNGVSQSVDDARVAIYGFQNSGAGTPVITVTMIGTAPKDANCASWSSVATSGGANATATGNTAASTTHASGSVTPSASALILSAIGFSADPGTRTPTDFTALNIDAGAAARQWYGYKTAATGATNPTITTGNSVSSDSVTAAWLATGGGGGFANTAIMLTGAGAR